MARTGRYKALPVIGLALMTLGLLALSQLDADTSRLSIALRLVVFALGFGLVSQVLVVAVQNGVNRRDIGIATASTNLFRALGGSISVALFGAIFVARLDVWLPRTVPAAAGRLDASGIQAATNLAHWSRRSDPAWPRRSRTRWVRCSWSRRRWRPLGLLCVLFLREVPLKTGAR